MEKNGYHSSSLVGFTTRRANLSKKAVEIISSSWREGTEKRYNSHIKKFVEFCAKRNEDSFQATTETGIDFLTEYFQAG